MKLWSGLSAEKVDIDRFLDVNLAKLNGWRENMRRILPQSEREELQQWGRIYFNHNYTENYCLVAMLATAALNRPDRDPEEVLKVLAHEGTSRGLFLEARR